MQIHSSEHRLRVREAEDDNEARDIGTCNWHENRSNLIWHPEWSKFNVPASAKQMRENSG